MKIKIDENIPYTLAGKLAKFGHDVDSVYDESLSGQDDDRIWKESQKEGRFLITQDLDFSDIRKFKPGKHHGLLIVRLRMPGNDAVAKRILQIASSIDLDEFARCFVVVTDNKLRIRRPTTSKVL